MGKEEKQRKILQEIRFLATPLSPSFLSSLPQKIKEDGVPLRSTWKVKLQRENDDITDKDSFVRRDTLCGTCTSNATF